MPIIDMMAEATAATNIKNVAEAPAFYSGLAMGNAVAHQQAMQQVQIAATGAIVKGLTEIDPTEAVSALKATSGNEVAGTIAAILGALGSGQQSAKVAQTTPPPTGG